MSFMDRIRDCNTEDLGTYRPLMVEGARVGMISADFAGVLTAYSDVFAIDAGAVTLAPGLADFHGRTAAVAEVAHDLHGRGIVKRWRNEDYRVGTSFGTPPLFQLNRGAVANFGVLGYGIHVNGWVREADGTMSMWLGRRALDKASAPGKLDQLVAGGQPAGLTLEENLIKESAEEADIPADLALRAKPVGVVSYMVERPEGLRRDVLFNYDLELPPDFTPVNTDGEVDGFELWPLDQVLETVRTSRSFKFNCSLVVIDFAIRHGLIAPEHPDYVELQVGLRRAL